MDLIDKALEFEKTKMRSLSTSDRVKLTKNFVTINIYLINHHKNRIYRRFYYIVKL